MLKHFYLLILGTLIFSGCSSRSGYLADGGEFTAYDVIVDSRKGGFIVPLEWTRQDKKFLTGLADIYEGVSKEALAKAGFTDELMINYYRQGNQEFMSFPDWVTAKDNDVVTFVIEDNQVKYWFKDN